MVNNMMQFEVEAKSSRPRTGSESGARYLVLGDFGGRPTEPLTVDRDSLDDVLSRLDVSVSGIRMREVEDFHPDHLYHRLDEFAALRESGAEQAPAEGPRSTPYADIEEILRPGSLLEQIAGGGDPFQQYVRDLARAAAAPAKGNDDPRIAVLGERMRAMLHHPRFQALEATWRGLEFVVRQADETVHIHIAQFSRADLERDLAGATNLRTTRTFALLHAREWSGIFGLYAFGSSPEDIELLGRIALVAAHAHAPFVAEGSVDMGQHWRELQQVPEAGQIALALPRFLLRLPYGAKTSKIESFPFEEMPDVLKGSPPRHAQYLWGHPALAVLTLLARIEEDSMENGNPNLDLRQLPVHNYQQDGEWKMTPCAEVWLSEQHVRALIDLGMIPLVAFRDQDRVRVAGLRAINGGPFPLGR
jgi:type VI secretion system protein ImpC